MSDSKKNAIEIFIILQKSLAWPLFIL